MARPTHSFSWLRGVIKLAQLATGSGSAGRIPVSNGTTTVWTDPTDLPGYGGGGSGGGGGWVIDGTDGTKLETGRIYVKSATEGSNIYLGETAVEIDSGGSVGLYAYGADPIVLYHGDETGMVIPKRYDTTPPTFYDDGHVYVETYGGSFHFLEMAQPDVMYPAGWYHIGQPSSGWLPQAFPVGYVHNGTYTTTRTLAPYETLALPMILTAPMSVQSMRFWGTDTTLVRQWETSLWHQPLDATGALKRVPGSHQYGGGSTVSAAAMRGVSMSANECHCPAGLVWLTIMNSHATNTLGIGYMAGSTQMPVNLAQRKVLSATGLDSETLDFVAATWTKMTDIHAASLVGRTFGSAAF